MTTNPTPNYTFPKHDALYLGKYPAAFRRYVTGLATPLLVFLCFRYKHDVKGFSQAVHSLWRVPYDPGWPGDMLSSSPSNSVTTPSDALLFKNRFVIHLILLECLSMCDRLSHRLVKGVEHDVEVGGRIEMFNESATRRRCQPRQRSLRIRYRMPDIPMRYMWLNIYGDIFDTYPYVCAVEIVAEGHIELVSRFGDAGVVDFGILEFVCIDYIHTIHPGGMTYGGDGESHMGILELLDEVKHTRISATVVDFVAMNDCVEVTDRLDVNHIEGSRMFDLNKAANHGHQKTGERLHENHIETCTSNTIYHGTKNEGIKTDKSPKKSRSNGSVIDHFGNAVRRGYLGIVKWLHEGHSDGRAAGDNNGTGGKRKTVARVLHDIHPHEPSSIGTQIREAAKIIQGPLTATTLERKNKRIERSAFIEE